MGASETSDGTVVMDTFYGEHILWRTHSIENTFYRICMGASETSDGTVVMNTFYGEHIL